MLRVYTSAVLIGTALLLGVVVPARAQERAGWKLVWSDEFQGDERGTPDPEKWSFEVGGNGWGNNELQTYTARPQNALVRKGKLHITARREAFRGTDGITRQYTSARLTTDKKFDRRYGRFEARIQLPRGRGVWPAFWLVDTACEAHWPDCGEIDIMEFVGSEPSSVTSAFHAPRPEGMASLAARYTLPGGKRFPERFHIFAVEWEPGVIRFYVDGKLYHARTPADLPPGARWAFDGPFFVVLNVAIGGDLPGGPDAGTVFPQTMQVDYVRVYERAAP